MILINHESMTEKSKRTKGVTYNSKFMPIDVGNMTDIAYAINTFVKPNGYGYLLLGIGLPGDAGTLPKRSDVAPYLDGESLSDLEDLKGRVSRNGSFESYFDRLVLLERALRGDLPLSNDIIDLLDKTGFNPDDVSFEDMIIMPKHPHDIYPFMFDTQYNADRQGYLEPPKETIQTQIIYLDEKGHDRRCEEKRAHERNIHVTALNGMYLDRELVESRDIPLLRENDKGRIMREIKQTPYKVVVMPFQPFGREQKRIIDVVYDKSNTSDELVFAVPYGTVPMNPSENANFWRRVSESKDLPFSRFSRTREYIKDSIGDGRVGHPKLRNIHTVPVEVDDTGAVAKTKMNHSYLPDGNCEFVRVDKNETSVKSSLPNVHVISSTFQKILKKGQGSKIVQLF